MYLLAKSLYSNAWITIQITIMYVTITSWLNHFVSLCFLNLLMISTKSFWSKSMGRFGIPSIIITSTNQPMGKGQLWMIYPLEIEHNNGELLFFIGKTHYFYDQFDGYVSHYQRVGLQHSGTQMQKTQHHSTGSSW